MRLRCGSVAMATGRVGHRGGRIAIRVEDRLDGRSLRMTVETVTQLLLSGLLLLTVVWCTLVHRRLARLRADRGEIEAFVASLATVTERAEAAIAGLRAAAESIAHDLASKEEHARRTVDSLGRLAEAAGRTARRLDMSVAQASRLTADAGIPISPVRPSPPVIEPQSPTPMPTPQGPAASRETAIGDGRMTAELKRILQGLR